MNATITPPAADGASRMRLRVHIQHRLDGSWFVDIDDESDRQPDDPYWCLTGCHNHTEAVTAACAQLQYMSRHIDAVQLGGRLSGWRDNTLSLARAA